MLIWRWRCRRLIPTGDCCGPEWAFETEAPGLPFARIRHYAHTMPMPDFPVDLGPNPIQTTDPSDYGRIVYNTQVGKQSVRNTPKPDPIVHPEGFGRYEDA